MQRATEANPDRVEVWDALATHLQTFGTQAGIDEPLERAVAAADRALAIDTQFLSVLSLRTYLALLQGRPAEIRTQSDRFFNALGDTTRATHWRWAVARALGHSARMPALLERVALGPGFAWLNIELWATRYGLASNDDAERVGALRQERGGTTDERSAAHRSLFRIASALAQLDDAKLANQISITMGGNTRNVTRSARVLGHALDRADHYSQLANYMRLNNILPPTALPRPAGRGSQ